MALSKFNANFFEKFFTKTDGNSDSKLSTIVPLAIVAGILGFGGWFAWKRSKSTPSITDKKFLLLRQSRANKRSNTFSSQLQQHLELDSGLPLEVWLHIFSFLDDESLARSMQVCRRWNEWISNEYNLWRSLFEQRWPELNIPNAISLNKSTAMIHYYREVAVEEKQRLSFEPYRYLLSIMKPTQSSSNWEHPFLRSLMDAGVVLQDGVISNDSIAVGRYRWIPLRDGIRKFSKERAALLEEIGCPYIGNTVGFLNFEFVQPEASRLTDDFRFDQACINVIRALTYEARGLVGRVDTGYVDSCVTLEEFPIKEAFSKFGLNDGDLLLDADMQSTYIQDLLKEVNDFFQQVSPSSRAYVVGTTHNPLRMETTLTADELEGTTLRIWILNFSLLTNRRLWNF